MNKHLLIYLSSATRYRSQLRRYRAQIYAETSHQVLSSWLDDFRPSASLSDKERGEVAQKDLDDIERCGLCIGFSFKDRHPGSGGRHFELGYAFSICEAWKVGPPEHVFHFLPGMFWFATWENCLARLRSMDANTKGGTA